MLRFQSTFWKHASDLLAELFKRLLLIIFHLLVALWRFIWWAWGTLIVGGLILGSLGNASYTYFTKGQFDPINLTQLSVIQLIYLHPLRSAIVFLGLGGLTFASFLAHQRHQRLLALPVQSEYTLQRVNHLHPNNYKLFHYIAHAYIFRGADHQARHVLAQMATTHSSSPNTIIGICILGRPTQGKTRLAWDAMHHELGNWTLVRWPHERSHPFNFAAQRDQRLVLWLDDLHEYATPIEANPLNDLLRQFTEAGAHFIVLATCRDGDDYLRAQKYLGSLLERLTLIHLSDISNNEAADLAKLLTQSGIDIHENEFDGTPGSLIVGVKRMKERYLRLPPYAQAVLKTMKLLRSAGIYTYFESVVRFVVHDLFALNEKEWKAAWACLDQEDFLTRSQSESGEYCLEPTADVYIEKTIVDYPSQHTALADEWPELMQCFIDHQDANGLTSVGIAFAERLDGHQQRNKQYAIICFRSILEVYTRQHTPNDWAMTQNNLGSSLTDLASLAEGQEQTRLLQEAITIFRSTLEVFTHQHAPNDWAMTQNNLANALTSLASLTEGQEQPRLLQEAVTAYHAALEVFTHQHDPNQWATIQNNLASALTRQASLAESQEQPRLLQEAVVAFHAALEVRTRQHAPNQWAITQHNLAYALRNLANLAEGQERLHLLQEAVTAYHAALEVFTRQYTPSDWAMTQNNLANALVGLANLTESREPQSLLQEAVIAFHAALEVYTRQHAPIDWAMTQHNLAGVLTSLARLAEGQECLRLLQEAVTTYYASLEVRTRQHAPNQWAMTQNNLANALTSLASLAEGQEQLRLLQEAVIAYHAALEVYTRQYTPNYWAITQTNLAGVLTNLASLAEGQEQLHLLQEAVAAYSFTLEVFTHQHAPNDWAMTQTNLANALTSLASLTEGQEQPRLLQEAVTAYHAALEVFTHQHAPNQWAMIQNNLAVTLCDQAELAEGQERLRLLQKALDSINYSLTIFSLDAASQQYIWAEAFAQAVTTAIRSLQAATDEAEKNSRNNQ